MVWRESPFSERRIMSDKNFRALLRFLIATFAFLTAEFPILRVTFFSERLISFSEREILESLHILLYQVDANT